MDKDRTPLAHVRHLSGYHLPGYWGRKFDINLLILVACVRFELTASIAVLRPAPY
jgi:hypothetical protein